MQNDGQWKNERLMRMIFGIVIFVLLISIVFNFAGGFYMGTGMMFFQPGWVWSLVGLFFVIWVISWIIRWPYGHRHWRALGGAEEILKRRYAKGEISQVQYKKMLAEIRKE